MLIGGQGRAIGLSASGSTSGVVTPRVGTLHVQTRLSGFVNTEFTDNDKWRYSPAGLWIDFSGEFVDFDAESSTPPFLGDFCNKFLDNFSGDSFSDF